MSFTLTVVFFIFFLLFLCTLRGLHFVNFFLKNIVYTKDKLLLYFSAVGFNKILPLSILCQNNLRTGYKRFKKQNLALSFLGVCIVFSYGCHKETEVKISADFIYEVLDSNYNVPVKINFANTSSGAQFYKWTFVNGNPDSSTYKNPGIIEFTKPGTITVKLEAWNDYDRKEKTVTIVLDTVPKADFTASAILNNISPVDYNYNFTGTGATEYQWIFNGGVPAISTERNPSHIHYDLNGTYDTKLIVKNWRGRTDTIQKTIIVRPALSAAFDVAASFETDDYQVPFIATLDNHTVSATTHLWQATGGVLSSALDSVPTVTYTNPGNYSIQYTASNGKQTQTVTKNITLYPNTHLRTFSNIHLGINTAHATIGSFFSTYLRKIIKQADVTTGNSAQIDICYFGLNQTFSFNQFISPTIVQNWTFPPIANASNTIYVNKMEGCGCGINITSAQFDAIADGSFFNNITVPASGLSNDFFDNTVPSRVVMFQNASGKKGAIKISQYIVNGTDSYIVCDIKVQK